MYESMSMFRCCMLWFSYQLISHILQFFKLYELHHSQPEHFGITLQEVESYKHIQCQRCNLYTGWCNKYVWNHLEPTILVHVSTMNTPGHEMNHHVATSWDISMAPLLRAPSSLAGQVLDMERASASTVGGFHKFMIFDDKNIFLQNRVNNHRCINLHQFTKFTHKNYH